LLGAEAPETIEMAVLVCAKIAVDSIDREMSPTASAVKTTVVDILPIMHKVQQELLIFHS
jgi:hypothetical protein